MSSAKACNFEARQITFLFGRWRLKSQKRNNSGLLELGRTKTKQKRRTLYGSQQCQPFRTVDPLNQLLPLLESPRDLLL